MDAIRQINESGQGAVDPMVVLGRYYPPGEPLTTLLLNHSRRVKEKALAVADRVAHLNPDTVFIAQAAMLHDIGIFRTHSPRIHCLGSQPYVRHGIIGSGLLKELGLDRHALVCERHVGTGISKAEIISRKLDLPLRDMLPISLEEMIVCYADKFFSKSNDAEELPLETVCREIGRYGRDQLDRFLKWHAMFA